MATPRSKALPAIAAKDDAGRPTARSTKAADRPDGCKRAMEEHLGEHLRALYQEVVSQPIPDRFLDLLEKLDGKGH
jgi:hypothetical protein